MSDVPELDRIIEEHERFRYNLRWNRREKFGVYCSRWTMCCLGGLLAVGLVGPLGLLAMPLVWAYAKKSIPDPQWRNPFGHYHAK